MAAPSAELIAHRFASFDGAVLGWYEMGPADGRPLVLLHGLFSNAYINWVKFGTAAALAAAGHRLIMPDLRAHGDSAAPHDPAAYPDDVLPKDGEALIAHLGLTNYDLGGFSLGGRTTARMLVRGHVRPRRAILAGMGLEGVTGSAKRFGWFREAIAQRDTVDRHSPYYFAVQFMRRTRIDPIAADLLLQANSAVAVEELAQVRLPVLVVAGDQDHDNGSAEALAELLPQGNHRAIRGTHMTSVSFPDLGREIAAFLAS